MDPTLVNKCYFPTKIQDKDLQAHSPSNKKLPSLSRTTNLPTKIPLPPQRPSPKAGSLPDTKSPKAGRVRLIPLSLEPVEKEKDCNTEPKKNRLQKKGSEGPKLFEASHVAVVFDARPISEQFAQEMISNKLSKKLTFKPYGEWLEKTIKKGNSLTPAVKNQTVADVIPSPQSKFKAKILTARAQELSVTTELKQDTIIQETSKEQLSLEISDIENIRRSRLRFPGGAALQGSKTFDGSLGRKSDKDTSRMVESILLHSTVSSRKSQVVQNSQDMSISGKGLQKSSQPSMGDLKVSQTVEIQPVPKKLFQQRNTNATRSPMLFMQSRGNNPLTGGRAPVAVKQGNGVVIPKAGGEAPQKEEKPKPVMKKETFHGEIRGNILKWKMGEFIGAGNFGQVYQGMEVESARIIAVKTIPIGNTVNKDLLDSLEVELDLLQKLKHKHIVQYLGHEKLDNNLFIYLESMSGGNIANIIAKYGALPEKTVKVYAKQILAGLIYLHENKVIHKDIKGANILVDGDGTVKLADFGCSRQLEKTLSNFEGLLSDTLKGSIPWMAPEVVKETGYGRRSDIWSFGCTILEMATGEAPWSPIPFDNPVPLLMKIATSDKIPTIPETLSNELKDFLVLCLQRDPKNRPYAQDLLSHPFLN